MKNYSNIVVLNNSRTRRYTKLRSFTKKMCQMIGIIGGMCAIGTVGALDTESITLVQGLIQLGVGSTVAIGCYLIYGKLN